MTIKHIIRREATKSREPYTASARTGPPLVTIPRPDKIRVRTEMNEAAKATVQYRRAEGFLKGAGGAMLQALLDSNDNRPVEVQFGNKVIRVEIVGEDDNG